MVETRGTRRTSWKLVSYEWGGGPPRWIKWRDEEGSVTDGVNGVKGTAHASFIRGGHRRDVVSNRVTRGWIEWREGGRNQEEVTKVTSCRPLASQTNIPLIKRIKWVLALLVFFFFIPLDPRGRVDESNLLFLRFRIERSWLKSIQLFYRIRLFFEKNNEFLKGKTRYKR